MPTPAKAEKVLKLGGYYVEVRIVEITNGKKTYDVPRARFLKNQEIAKFRNKD